MLHWINNSHGTRRGIPEPQGDPTEPVSKKRLVLTSVVSLKLHPRAACLFVKFQSLKQHQATLVSHERKRGVFLINSFYARHKFVQTFWYGKGFFKACTKTRNGETKPPKRNHRNKRNETTETAETSATTNTKEAQAKPPKQPKESTETKLPKRTKPPKWNGCLENVN